MKQITLGARVVATMLVQQGMTKENIQEIKPLFKSGWIPEDHNVLMKLEDNKIISIENLPEDQDRILKAQARQLAKSQRRQEARQRSMERKII